MRGAISTLPITALAVAALQKEAAKLPQAELHTEHFFADGMYCRVLFRKKDTLIIGKTHRKEHLYIVCSGTVRVISDGERKDIEGPAVIVSKPGTKRAVYALTDATCLTVHRTDNTELDAIEAELIEEEPEALYDSYNRLKQDMKELT